MGFVFEPLYNKFTDGQQCDSGVHLHHKDGHRVSVAVKTIPLFIDRNVIGAVEVFEDNNQKAETNKTISELKTLALYDQLTELPNRRYFDSFLNTRLNEFHELKIPFAAIMLDIDHFKNVNDTYGHDTGDLVLKMVAKTLKSAFRKNDLIGRWGGEEFLAVLTSLTEEDLTRITEKARNLVEKSALRNADHLLNVNISIGATMVRKDDTAESIKKRADQALYTSKETGRNRVTIL